uniref:Transposase IS204/IS1001/IS1096/IS1165 DDE domain-containing protein n=1 Tax=Strigamia maritima TaxID=126957 RepID=T1JEN1_STRMM
MDLDTGKVVAIQIVQSNEVGSSNAMEKEGLLRILDFLGDEEINVKALVTDRHISIRKMLREDYPEIKHFLDIWHISKSLSKKIDAIAKQKKCKTIGEWKNLL